MTAPQIVRGMPMAEYQALKALSASGAWALSEECPARFWHASPWNPEYTPDHALEFNIGTALHLAVLGPDEFAARVAVIQADDFRTKAAREARDEAYAGGLVPLLEKHLDLVAAMDRAVHADPYAAELLDDDKAENEVSFFWDDARTGTRCKARVDRLSRGALIDLKTAECAAERVWQAKAYREGHFLRAPWYLDGVEVATGRRPRRYAFLVVEKEPPHVVQIYDLDERAMEWGRLVMRRALDRFAACMRSGRWDAGYHAGPVTIGLPTYAEYQLADREQAGEFSGGLPRGDMAAEIRRGFEFLAP